MAKTPSKRDPLPGVSKPTMERPRYRKTTSYGPEQADHDAYCSFWPRPTDETPSTVSPSPPATHTWGNGSYDANGRGVRTTGAGVYGAGGSNPSERGPGYGAGGGGAKLDPGPNTGKTVTPGKPMRPGRW